MTRIMPRGPLLPDNVSRLSPHTGLRSTYSTSRKAHAFGARVLRRADEHSIRGVRSSGMYPVCSFCGERSVVAWFEAPKFLTRVDSADKVRAVEAWLTCATCLELVDANDRDRLVERAVQRLVRKHPERSLPPSEALQQLERRQLDELFWSRRT